MARDPYNQARGDTPARYPSPAGAGAPPSTSDRIPAGRRAGRARYRNQDILAILSECDAVVVTPDAPLIDPGDTAPGQCKFTLIGSRNDAMTRQDMIEIVAMRGTVRDDTPGSEGAGVYEFSSVGLQIKEQSGLDLITSGAQGGGSAFALYSDLFTTAQPFYILGVDVPADHIYALIWKNFQPSTTGHSLQVSLTFFCRTRPPEQ